MTARNFTKIESDYDTRLVHENAKEPLVDTPLERVTSENYSDYEAFRDQFCEGMLVQLWPEEWDEMVYFVEEENTEELEAAIRAGFLIRDTYRCYQYQC